MSTNIGPTVAEAAQRRLRQIDRQLEALYDERKAVIGRLLKYAGSSQLESERIATRAESFQATQLPK